MPADRDAAQQARRFQETFDVSRETTDRLELYCESVRKWTKSVNLISKNSERDLWDRHVVDSAQLWRYCPPGVEQWMDLGSGGGFPGIVIAIIAFEKTPTMTVTMVESDRRKSIFLGEIVRILNLNSRVIDRRIQNIEGCDADVVSARALAPISELLSWTLPLRRKNGICLFPKGVSVHKELTAAARIWRFDHRLHASVTEQNSAIVEIGAFERV